MSHVLDTFTLHPAERELYDISFERYLARHQDTIQTAEVTTPSEGLQISYAFAGGVVRIWVSGPPGKHIVAARIHTTAGRRRRGAIAIRIKGDPPCEPPAP